ncbi:sensor histidine kinase [Sporolactobacillus terrae]|uniref:sensor histidine kinase n=1 Tax=Sporolactobacillus terrae TaxID=269673 RepID=UPI00048A659B|nr:ATP-binding protein [Sporolactobacillus terrae]UAK15975.1 ATP-binding protein [Sporolactobacillus terrae]
MTATSMHEWNRRLLLGCLCLSLAASVRLSVMSHSGGLITATVLPAVSFVVCFGLALSLWLANCSKKGEQLLICFLCLVGLLWQLAEAGDTSAARNGFQTAAFVGDVLSLLLLMHILEHYLSYWGLVWLPQSVKWIVSAPALGLLGTAAGLQIAGFPALRPAALLLMAALMALALAASAHVMIVSREAAYRPMLHVLLFGLLFSCAPALIGVVCTLNGVSSIPMPVLFPGLLPLLLAYLVCSERFMDLSFTLKHASYCALIAALPSVFISIVFYHVSAWGNLVADRSDVFVTGILMFLVLFFMLYIKQYLDYSLRKRLNAKQQDVQIALNRFLQWIENDDDLENIGPIIEREVENCLPVERAQLLVLGKEDETNPYFSYASRGDPGEITATQEGFRILLSESALGKIVLVAKWTRPRRRLNPDERVWLAALISYAQIVIENRANINDLMKNLEESAAQRAFVPMTIKKMMLRISERERFKWSRRLHDQNMQDQLDIARQLDAWGKESRDPQTKALMVGFREQVLDGVYVLRQVINDLHPEFIYRTGLKKALLELFDKVNLRADFKLYGHVDDRLDGFQNEWDMAVYRVVQELLNNAQKHAQAHCVHLNLMKKNDRFMLTYSDDGIGLNVSAIGKSFGTMGLPGMIGRVEGMGGHLAIDSQPGSGLRISIQWTKKGAYA